MIFSNRIFYYREKEVTGEARQVITQLGLVMDANKTEVWTMDPVKRLFTLYGNEGEQTKVLTPKYCQMSKTIRTPSLAHHPSSWESQSSVRTQAERKQGRRHHPSPRTRRLCSQTQWCFVSEKAHHGALIHARSPPSDLFLDMQTPGTPTVST